MVVGGRHNHVEDTVTNSLHCPQHKLHNANLKDTLDFLTQFPTLFWCGGGAGYVGRVICLNSSQLTKSCINNTFTFLAAYCYCKSLGQYSREDPWLASNPENSASMCRVNLLG